MLLHHIGKNMGASMSNVKSITFEDTEEGVVMWCKDEADNFIKVLLPKRERQLKMVGGTSHG